MSRQSNNAEYLEPVEPTPPSLITPTFNLFRKHRLNKKQKEFLSALAATNCVRESARRTRIDPSMHYYWIKRYENYVKALALVDEVQTSVVKAEVYRRGVLGFNEDVYFRGIKVGKKLVYSDNLLILEAKRRDNAYRDNFSINQFAGPVQLNVNMGSKVVDPLQLDRGNNRDNKDIE